MVTSMLPPFRSYYQGPIHQHHQTMMGVVSPNQPQSRIMVSRNFSATGDGKSLLHQTFDTKMPERNSSAPLRTNINTAMYTDSIPRGLLYILNILIAYFPHFYSSLL
jgi:hypothetical protein